MLASLVEDVVRLAILAQKHLVISLRVVIANLAVLVRLASQCVGKVGSPDYNVFSYLIKSCNSKLIYVLVRLTALASGI